MRRHCSDFLAHRPLFPLPAHRAAFTGDTHATHQCRHLTYRRWRPAVAGQHVYSDGRKDQTNPQRRRRHRCCRLVAAGIRVVGFIEQHPRWRLGQPMQPRCPNRRIANERNNSCRRIGRHRHGGSERGSGNTYSGFVELAAARSSPSVQGRR